jgi:hypothetical protein
MNNAILFSQEIYKGFELSTYISEELNIQEEITTSSLNNLPMFGTFSLNFDSVAKAKAKIDNYFLTINN